MTDDEFLADYNRRADEIQDVLEDADHTMIPELLSRFAARYLGGIIAEDRETARRALISLIDEKTKSWVVGGCDA
jgi:hypothetical protein